MTTLGIDIGTSKVAAVIATADGALLAAASRPHEASRPALPGHAEQDADVLLKAAWAVVGELPADLRREVRAVGVTGQMHGVLVFDGAGKPVTPLVTWQDQRALADGFLDALRRCTGHQVHSGYGNVTLAWMARHGALPASAAGACTIQDLAAARLCGLDRPVMDASDAASWGLLALPALEWDRDAVAAAGVPAALLPAVVPIGSRIGGVQSCSAEPLGVPAGIPVAAALGDNQASLLASLREPVQELALTLGTGAQLSAVLRADAAIDWAHVPPTCEYRPYAGGRWAVVAASFSGGSAWAWLADRLNDCVAQLGRERLPRDEVFTRLNALGLAAAEELQVHPLFWGERHNPSLRGSIAAIGDGNFCIGPLARGLARGILLNLREMLPAEACAGRVRVVASGNALRRNPLLLHMAGEVLALPVVMRDAREEAAVGAALNAAPL